MLGRDEKLVALYRQTGDQKYFEEIHTRYRPQLDRFLSNYLQSKPEVDRDGIINATFIGLHTFCQSSKPIRPVRAWLFEGARLRAWEAIRNSRRKKRGNGELTQVELDPQMPDSHGTPAEEAERGDVHALVLSHVRDLPGEQEQAVHLVYIAGRTLEDAAQCLGISLATIKRRVRTGLDTLRTKIGEEIFAVN